ncbi:hypothetical protein [Parafrankia sp. BMG5.11]|nr:hypothetical protein [Parafrankia sp. BMG5.11]
MTKPVATLAEQLARWQWAAELSQLADARTSRRRDVSNIEKKGP